MGQATCVLPVRCKQCNAIFDLWYDLEQEEYPEISVVSSHKNPSQLAKQSLCWRCRQMVDEFENNKKAEDDIEGTSYEVLFDFE